MVFLSSSENSKRYPFFEENTLGGGGGGMQSRQKHYESTPGNECILLGLPIFVQVLQMNVSSNGCTKIFFIWFNTSHDNIVIRLCGWTHLHTGKPGKSNMFSARVKTTASKRSESTERKWIFTLSALKYNCRKHLNQSPQSSAFQALSIWFHWCTKCLSTISIALKIHLHQDDVWISKLCVKIQICA